MLLPKNEGGFGVLLSFIVFVVIKHTGLFYINIIKKSIMMGLSEGIPSSSSISLKLI